MQIIINNIELTHFEVPVFTASNSFKKMLCSGSLALIYRYHWRTERTKQDSAAETEIPVVLQDGLGRWTHTRKKKNPTHTVHCVGLWGTAALQGIRHTCGIRVFQEEKERCGQWGRLMYGLAKLKTVCSSAIWCKQWYRVIVKWHCMYCTMWPGKTSKHITIPSMS